MRKATALGSGPSGIRVRGAEFTSIRLSFLIELRLKVAALLRESVEIGIVLALVSVILQLELILLLLVNRTLTLRMYLGIVEGLAPVSQCRLGSADFVAPRCEKVVKPLLFIIKSFKTLLRMVRNGCERLRT